MIAIPALARTRGPNRSEAAPLNGATMAIVIGTGVSSRPASIGEKPRALLEQERQQERGREQAGERHDDAGQAGREGTDPEQGQVDHRLDGRAARRR